MKKFLLAVALVFFYVPISSAQERPLYLTGGHLVDVVRGEIYEDVAVVIEAGKITDLFYDFSFNEYRVPENALHVDVKGKYLIPGLTDMHVHTPTTVHGLEVDMEHFYRLLLKSGITTIRALAINGGASDDKIL